MRLNYVVDKKELEKMKEIMRTAFRRELGIEVDFIRKKNGEIKVVPAKRTPDPRQKESGGR